MPPNPPGEPTDDTAPTVGGDEAPSPVTASRANASASSWSWLSPALQLIAATSALAYATIHVSYQNFYDQLGLTPEDVGATSTTILAQSSLRILEFGILFALVPVLLVLATYLALVRWLTTRSSPRARKRRVALALPAILPYVAYQLLTDGRTYSSVALFSVIALALLALLASDSRESSWRDPLRARGGSAVIVLWIGLAVAWTVLTSLAYDAKSAGLCVRDGIAVRYIHTHRHIPFLARIPVLRVHAEPATVQAADVPRDPLLYLGQANGSVVLWDATTRNAIIVPSPTLLELRTSPDRAPSPMTCRAYIS
jgi:hypothetical protein